MKFKFTYYQPITTKLILFQTLFFILVFSSSAKAQNSSKRALFLGNSYTNVNNLPQMIADISASTNDTLIIDSNTPGGYTLQGHSTNITSLAKIALGNWDYVVLQEQSQLPSFPIGQVETEVFPYAQLLDSLINAENTCAETVFYMTWGRKNGDASNCASWTPVCTYAGMDSLLNLRYCMMADSNNAILSPVGAIWNYLRQNFPLIELYQTDESHPTVAGTYAAACSFYTAMFRKDPTAITFNSTLTLDDATNIKNATKLLVYNNLLNWHIGQYDSLNNLNCIASYIIEENNYTFQVFPNPSSGKFVIKSTHLTTSNQLIITDLLGRQVYQSKITNPEFEVDLSEFGKGIYIIGVTSGNQISTLKQIIIY